MSIRDHYRGLGISVSDLTDAQLEAVGLDILAEFGEIPPTVDELREIVQRHRTKPQSATWSEYVPAIELHALLDFEAEDHGRRKDREIRESFGVSPARYVLLLNRALDDPAAMLYAPQLVARLTRIRDARRDLRWGSRVSA